MITYLKQVLNHTVFKNFSVLTIGNVFSQLIGFFSTVMITKAFLPAEYGVFTFLLVQGQLLIDVGDLGIRNIVIRSIARNRFQTNDLIINGVKIRIAAVFILILIYILYNHYLGNLSYLQLSLICSLSLVSCVTNLFETVFFGYQIMLYPSIINFTFSIIWLITVFGLPTAYFNANILFSAFLLLALLKGITFYVFLKIKNLLLGAINDFWSSSRSLLTKSWPYFMQSLLIIPIVSLPNNFLDINSNSIEIAYFNLSQKLIIPITLIIGLALSAIFPNLSLIWEKDEHRFFRLISKGFKYYMLTILILCSLFTLFAEDLITFIFSESYLPAIKVCRLQIWFVFFMGVNGLIGTIWGATNKEKLIFQAGLINAFISVPMLYYGSKYGALGLSYGYVISFAIFEFFLWYKFKKSTQIKIKDDVYLWIITLILFLISFFFPHEISSIYRIILALIIICLAGIYLLKSNKLIHIR